MAYFDGQGRQLGQMPPQASTNGFGRMPPQASTNGFGIGMTPPQAQAGFGQAAESTPAQVPGTNAQPLSPALPGGRRAFRDGIFGRRQPEPYGESIRPWRDGIFGPSLGLGQTNGNNAVLDMNKPEVVLELTAMLSFLSGGAVTQSSEWTEAHSAELEAEQAQYVEMAPEARAAAGIPDPGLLFQKVAGLTYPTGTWVSMAYGMVLAAPAEKPPLAKVTTWVNQCMAKLSPNGRSPDEQAALVNVRCPVLAPGAVLPGDGGMRASTVALLGVGAAIVGLGIITARGRGRGKRRKKRRRRR